MEWFARPDAKTGEVGLRFTCTGCGRCCTGAPGYVSFTGDEARAMADLLGVSVDTFMDSYTHDTEEGRSLREVATEYGHDCVFLDREPNPDRPTCRVYAARPAQCRTWPFWKSNLASRRTWNQTMRACPGAGGGGRLHSPQQIRVLRDEVEM